MTVKEYYVSAQSPFSAFSSEWGLCGSLSKIAAKSSPVSRQNCRETVRGRKLFAASYFIIFVSILLFSYKSSYAIGDDSTYHRYNPLWTHYFHVRSFNDLQPLDTSLNRLEFYDIGKAKLGYTPIGNLGDPYFQEVFNINDDIGYDIGFHSFDQYLYTPDNINFYDTKKAYSQLFYVFGEKSEQQLNGTHTQNITKRLNMGFEFRRTGSDGAYQSQRADVFNVDVFASYVTKNEHYHIFPYFIYNRVKWYSNGGVKNDSVFTDTLALSKDLEAVRLDSALTTFKGVNVGFTHAYDWGSTYSKKINDTTTVKRFVPLLRLQHHLDYAAYKYLYHDLSNDFPFYYNRAYIDTSQTNDTLRWKKIENTVSLELLPIKKQTNDTTIVYRRFVAAATLDHQLILVNNLGQSSSIQEVTGGLHLNSTDLPGTKLDYSLSGNAGLQNFDKPTYTVKAELGYSISKWIGEFYIAAQSTRKQPSYIEDQYLSNNLEWKNDFSAYTQSYAEAAWVNRKFSFSINFKYYTLSNFIYWNISGLPQQATNNITGYALYVKKNFKLGSFHLDNELVVQNFSDQSVISLPTYVGEHSFYFQHFLFKTALQLRAGVDVHYTSDYFIPAFLPSTSQFYLQNNELGKFYPVTDVFVNAKIRSVRIFAKIENADQGLILPGYFVALHYPAPDLAFKIGISWMFWN